MLIRKYRKRDDEQKLMKMIEDEEGWDYANADLTEKYKDALVKSITYVAYLNDELCGYSRSLDDAGLYVYVVDLLVKPNCRGNDIGRQLMEILCKEYPSRQIYVASGADAYYEKIGYKREGSIFEIKTSK